jgi:hypothetical protein
VQYGHLEAQSKQLGLDFGIGKSLGHLATA